MKLNSNCVRDVMLAVEAAPYNTAIRLSTLHELLPNYSIEELNYTCLKLEEGGFIVAHFSSLESLYIPNLVCILYLTYQGHEFIEKIRDEKQWISVQKGLTTVRNYSLSAIGAIAESITTAAINAYINHGI